MVEKPMVRLDHVLEMAEQLSSVDQARLVEKLATRLAEKMREQEPPQIRSLEGLWADAGVDISAEDIDAARREMWGNFPRQDIF